MNTNSKLKAYAALSAAFLAGTELQSQVLINDFEPDARLLNWENDQNPNDSLLIDIDGNGEADLIFIVADFVVDDHSLFVTPADMVTAIYCVGTDSDYQQAMGLSTGFVIGTDIEESNWKDDDIRIKHGFITTISAYYAPDYCSYWTNTFNKSNQYYGLRMNIDGNIHYGWMRLDSRSLLGYQEDPECATPYGSPVTIFEAGYELTADQSIIADNHKLQNIDRISLRDITDSNDFSELDIKMINYGEKVISYDEMRVYLIADSIDAINFSVAEALILPSTNYAVFEMPDIIDNTAYFPLPPAMKDINGNDFDASKSYVAYIMKMPLDGSALTLSSVTPVIHSSVHECSINVFFYDVTIDGNTGTAADIEVFFTNLTGDASIGEYRISLSTTYEEFDPLTLDSDQYQTVIPTGDGIYTTTLPSVLRDVDGNPISPGIYFIKVWALPDDELASIFCISEEWGVAVTTSTDDQQYPGLFTLVQSGNELQIAILDTDGNYSFFISDLTGQQIINSDLHQGENNFELDQFATGIYITAILKDGNIVGFKKIFIN